MDSSPQADKNPMRVLVVDDDPAFCRAVSHALKKDQLEVILATNSLTAIQVAKESAPKIVLIDLMMPGINGLQLLLALKENPDTCAIPVVVWTATVQEDLTRQALAFGADAMLVKTRFSMPELRRLVQRLVEPEQMTDDAPGMKRILVVEDDTFTREAVMKHLADSGFAVMEADNGWEALMALDRERIDLVLLDLVMPGMDGPTFLRILRNGRKYSTVPVIVVTAYDLAEMSKLVEPLGVSQIMGKRPPMWDNLLPAVRAVLTAA